MWQLVTYMFVHAGPLAHPLQHAHALDVRRRAGADVGHEVLHEVLLRRAASAPALTQVLLGILPFAFANQFYYPSTIGASGAIFGVLLAYALYFPTRPILMFFVFPVPAKYFVMILGAHGAALLARRRRRRRAHRAPWRTARQAICI